MSRKCLWDKSHPSFKKHKLPCRFLCEKCNKEIYSKYRGLFTPTQFKDNIDLIKEQRKLTSEREWNLGEAWVVEKLGLDTLVKLDLFENGLVQPLCLIFSPKVDRPAQVVHLFLTAWYAGP